MVLLVSCQDLVKHCLVTVEREAQITYPSSLAFLHQEVHDTVVHITTIELVHATAYSMQQIIVEIVHLQLLHGVQVHLLGFLKRPEVAVEIRQFGGYEILAALMSAQGDTCTSLRLTLTIHRTCVEVVHTMFYGIVHLFVDHILVKIVLVFRLRRQAHHAITQYRYFVTRSLIRAIGHLPHGWLYLFLVIVYRLGFTLRFATSHHSSGSHSTTTQYLEEIASVDILLIAHTSYFLHLPSSIFHQTSLCTSCPST